MTESQHQQALFAWAALAQREHPELKLLFAIPNGGARAKATAGRLKTEGVRAGVPDVCLPVPRGGFGACYIELKTPRQDGKPAGRLSPAQKDMLAALGWGGNFVAVCLGWSEAQQMLLHYLSMERA